MIMKLGTFNAHDNAAAVRRALGLVGQLLLVQEHVATRLPAKGWDHRAHGPAALATYWQPRHLRHVGSAFHRAHGGRAKVTPVRGTLLSRFRVGDLELAVLNSHRINRTRGRWLFVPRVHARWRAERWIEHDQLDRRLVADLIDSGCRLIIYGGDLNRRQKRVEPLHPAATPLLRSNAIDQLWLIDLDDQLGVGRSDVRRRLGSDHPLHRARLAVRQPL